jgi:hypothetical protein
LPEAAAAAAAPPSAFKLSSAPVIVVIVVDVDEVCSSSSASGSTCTEKIHPNHYEKKWVIVNKCVKTMTREDASEISSPNFQNKTRPPDHYKRRSKSGDLAFKGWGISHASKSSPGKQTNIDRMVAAVYLRAGAEVKSPEHVWCAEPNKRLHHIDNPLHLVLLFLPGLFILL